VLFSIDAAHKGGCMSLGKIAKALTARGIETPAGGREWNASQARRSLKGRRCHPRFTCQR